MKDKIIEILNKVKPGVDYENEHSLITDEIITSFELIMLASLLKEEFGVTVSVIDLVPENFENVESIEALVNKLK